MNIQVLVENNSQIQTLIDQSPDEMISLNDFNVFNLKIK